MRYQAPTPDMSKILSLTSNNQLNSAKKIISTVQSTYLENAWRFSPEFTLNNKMHCVRNAFKKSPNEFTLKAGIE